MAISSYPNGFSDGVLVRELPVNSPIPRKALYVGNNSTLLKGEKGASDQNDGSFLKPFSTIDYAIGQAKAGDVIYIRPGHNEGYDATTTGFDADVAGISIIGLGVGSKRPTFDFDHATAKCVIGADDIVIKNVIFRPSVTGVAIGLDLETGVTGCVLEDVEFAIGEDGAGVDEFIKAIHLTSGNDDTVFRNVKILAHADAGQATHGIHVDAASNRLTFDNVVIDGPFATNGILEDAAGLNHVVENCSIDTTGTNYGFHAASTFAKRVGNLDAGEAEDTAANFIGSDDNDNAADTSNVAADENGSVLERLEQIQEAVNKGTGTAVAANKSLVDAIGHDGDTSVATQTGTSFLVTKSLLQSAIVAGGADLTGVSSGGAILIEDVVIQNAGTAATSAASGATLEIYTDNAAGSASFITDAEAKLVANSVNSQGTHTTWGRVVLETGKKISVKATGEDFTSGGTITFHILCRRLANGTALAAAA